MAPAAGSSLACKDQLLNLLHFSRERAVELDECAKQVSDRTGEQQLIAVGERRPQLDLIGEL